MRSQDFKTRELREIAVVKIAEKTGSEHLVTMFYTNIETCAYAMPKSSQTAAAMLVTIEVPNIICI